MRERTLFNDGWRFRKGDGTEERTLNLPHDWGIEGPFDQTFPGETAKLPWWGVGIYRKRFLSPKSDAGRQVFLEIDGAMSHAEIHLNGHFVGAHPYGYASFHLDLTPYLEVGDENELEVRLDNPEESSRWYPGGGIYRNVWLTKTSPVHISHGGVFVTTPTVTEEAATVNVRVEIDETVSLATAIYDGENPVAFASAEGARGPFNLRLKVESPRLWSAESPHLYRAVTVVKKDEEIVDRVETSFGIREIRFDAETGLSVNGKPTYLKGVCLHHDLGALGAAFNLRAQERQLQILKEMGCNAIRTAHNPPAPELLDLCDRMGFYVIDEFSDTWRIAKKPNGYAKLFDEWHERDLRGMIRRDRNHPCVILWSTGNEVPEQTEDLEISRRLTAIAHEEDPSRLVTTGNDRPDSATNGFAETINVFGFNYKPHLYGPFREKYPSIPLYGSETSSTISSRGEYFFPVSEKLEDSMADFQLSSYDTAAPFWATTPDREFRGQDENPSVFGEFVWTGFDYLGEPSPYTTDTTVLSNYSDPEARAEAAKELERMGKIAVPSRSSYFGILDLCGFKKDRFFLYQARWRPNLPMAHLLPHWNWPERVGQVTPVHLYTSGDEAELFLNGVSQGRQKRGAFQYRFRWDEVVYAPGELKAVAYRNGDYWAEVVVHTSDPATKLLLETDRREIRSDGTDLAYITLTVADENDNPVPRSKPRIRFEIEGPGEIVATDNGDPTDLEIFANPERKAFNGLALAIVRAKRGETGQIRVTATADNLQSAEVVLEGC